MTNEPRRSKPHRHSSGQFAPFIVRQYIGFTEANNSTDALRQKEESGVRGRIATIGKVEKTDLGTLHIGAIQAETFVGRVNG